MDIFILLINLITKFFTRILFPININGLIDNPEVNQEHEKISVNYGGYGNEQIN